MAKNKLLSAALIAVGFGVVSFVSANETLVDSSFKSLTGSVVNGRVQFASPTDDAAALSAAQMNGNRSLNAMLKLTDLNNTLDAKINQFKTDADAQIAATNSSLATTNSNLASTNSSLAATNAGLAATNSQVSSLSTTVSGNSSAISYLQGATSSASSTLSSVQADLNATKAKLVNNLVYTAGQWCNTTLLAKQSDGTPLVCKANIWTAVGGGAGGLQDAIIVKVGPTDNICPAGYTYKGEAYTTGDNGNMSDFHNILCIR